MTRIFVAAMHARSSLATHWLWLQKVTVRPVNYLGPEGTFSHILARKRFGKHAVLTPSHH